MAKAKGKKGKKAAAKSNGVVRVAVRAGGIGNTIVAGIKAKKDNDAILAMVKKAHKGAKTTAACVAWYRSKLNLGAHVGK